MSHGVVSLRENGRATLSVDGTGGLFVERIVRYRNEGGTTYHYNSLAGLTLDVLQMDGAAFSWAIYYDWGYPRIVVTEYDLQGGNDYSSSLVLLVFVR